MFKLAFNKEELLQKIAFNMAINPSITMTELASIVGIAKASLHRIYSTRENLKKVIVQRVKTVYAEISTILNQEHSNYMEDLKNLIKIFCNNRVYILFIMRDVFTDCIDGRDWEKHDRELAAFFGEGQNKGFLNKNFSSEVMANVFLGILTWILHMQLEKSNIAQQDLENVIFQAFLNGVGNSQI